VSTIFTGIHLLLLVCILYNLSLCFVTRIPQVAKRTRARQDTLTDILKRIEKCFQPLEMHLEFLTTEMTDLIIQIMVEVLSIFGIAMVEIKQGHISKYFLYEYLSIN
jgi:hypothetical protein